MLAELQGANAAQGWLLACNPETHTHTHTPTDGGKGKTPVCVCVCVCFREAMKKEKQDSTSRKTES